MRPFAFTIQLLVASTVASAAAGMLVLFLLIASVAAGDGMPLGGIIFAAIFTLFVGGVAIIPAATMLTGPTLLVGGSLWLLARKRAWARRPAMFALAGACLGLSAYALLIPTGYLAALADAWPSGIGHPLGAFVFLIAGACSGLVFRSSMHLIGTFFGDDADEEEQLATGTELQ